MMNFKSITKYLRENGPAAATLGSMVLTALSVYFAIKKAPEGYKAKCEYEYAKTELDEKPIADKRPDDDISLKAAYAANLVKVYRESLVCAGGAICLSYIANKVNARTIAGLGAALALNETKLKKVYEKAEELAGKDGRDDLKEMTDSDIPPFDLDEPLKKTKHCHRKDIIEVFYDSFTGTKFESTGKNIENAISRANYRITNERTLNFNKWFSIVGLPDVRAGLCVGWNKRTCPFRVYTKLIYIDGEAVTGIFYENDPIGNYLD